MPIYEYFCDGCETKYEVLDLKARPETEKPCPKCKKMNGKIMSVTTSILADGGVGWEKNGYNRQRSIADGPEGDNTNRFKKSGKTTVPVRNSGFSIEPNKDKSKKKKPSLCVK